MNKETTRVMALRFCAARSRAATLFAAVALAACVGDGDDDASTSPTPAAPASLTLAGTAANGAALGGAAVDAKCKAGSASGTTGADGTYSLAIASGEWPCLARVATSSGALHSVAVGAGSSATADITPVTQLIVASLAAADPASTYAAFDASTAASVTSASVQAAVTSVTDTLKAAGIDLSTAGDVLAGTLVANNGSTAGNAYGQALATLDAKLTASGTTVATLTQTVSQTSPAAPVSSLSTVASLPAAQLLATAAPNCDSLRSGVYRFVVNEDGGTSPASGLVTIDAARLTANDGTETTPLTVTSPCSYGLDGGGEAVVSKAGVMTGRVGGNADSDTSQHGAVFFAEQKHTLAELAGEWNGIGFDRTNDNGPIHLTASTITFDATGLMTAITYCDDVQTCETRTAVTLPKVNLKVNPAGGFDFVNTTDNYTDRLFAYRAGGGELMLVTLSNSGHISFATRKVATVLPPLGRITESWNLTLTSQYTAPTPISVSRNTIASVDASTGTYVRDNRVNDISGATRPETLQINTFRDGYNHRPSASGVVASDGSISTVSEFVFLPMRGMGLSVLANLTSNQLVLSPVLSTTTP